MRITLKMIENFKTFLFEEEKSRSTIECYVRAVKNLYDFAEGRLVTKELVSSFKEEMQKKYKISSVNLKIIALNRFFKFMKKNRLCVKKIKGQTCAFIDEKELTMEEYGRLYTAAEKKGDSRMCAALKVFSLTGIRVSELSFITVEAVKQGKLIINNKGKQRAVFLPDILIEELLRYCDGKGIKNGPIFVTKNGKPWNRNSIWQSMKALGKKAFVSIQKIFPHNFRHMFARLFLESGNSIAELADILGHSSINTTRLYLRRCAKEQKESMNRTSQMFKNPSKAAVG